MPKSFNGRTLSWYDNNGGSTPLFGSKKLGNNMEKWLKDVMEHTDIEYDSLPKWKKELWEQKEFIQEVNRIRQANPWRYENDIWT